MARRIVVTSGKGGVGKTTVAVHLALALARKGERVVLFDGDFGLNGVDILLRIDQSETYDVVDVIEGKCRAKQALIRVKNESNLFVLLSKRWGNERYVSPQAMRIVVDGLSAQFDYIIIDCPSGLADGFHRAVSLADEAIVVTTSDLGALRAADQTVSALKNYKLHAVSVVYNRVLGERLTTGEIVSGKQVAELLKVPLLAVLPEFAKLWQGGINEHRAWRVLVKNVMTGERKIYDAMNGCRGIAGVIKRAVKER